MTKLYDLNLFGGDFQVDNINYKLISQLFVCVDKELFINVLLLQGAINKNGFMLLAVDLKNNKITPIPINLLNIVIRAIKNIPFSDELHKSIVIIKEKECEIVTDVATVKLSNNVLALVCHAGIHLSKVKVELELQAGNRIKPDNFMFAALIDGVNTSVYFELMNDVLKAHNSWGVLSEIKFYLDSEFAGGYYVQRNFILEEKVSFLCQTKLNSVLSRRTMAGMRTSGFSVHEISDLLVSSSGLINSVAYPEGYLQIQKWYTVIIPVTGLLLETEFGLGSVEFCIKQNSEIKRIIAFDNKFDNYETFALIHINSEKIFSAFLAAKRQIEQAIDLLICILKDDSIFSTHSLGEHLCERDITGLEGKVCLSSLAYIECPYSNSQLACDFANPDEMPELLVTEQFLQQKDELKKAEILLMKANGTNDEVITPLFNSLKWLRKSWDSDDFDDKIINVIIALEFIVSKEPSIPLISKSIRKKCSQAISEIPTKEIKTNENTNYLEAILNSFNRGCTDTPFKAKLQNLINRLNIPVSKDEMELIAKARDQRNDIVHGRCDSYLPTGDIYKLCECIGRIALYKINSLEV